MALEGRASTLVDYRDIQFLVPNSLIAGVYEGQLLRSRERLFL